MVHYKLTYFDIRGLGEPLRLMFQYAGVELDERRITFSEWPHVKHTTPTGKVPYIEVDGKLLTESGAIYRYFAKKFNLKPSDDWENAQMEAVVDWYKDYLVEIAPFFRVFAKLDEGDKDALFKELFIPASERVFPRLTEILSHSKSGFIAESGISWGDFFLAESILTQLSFDPDFGSRFPKVIEYQKKVHNVNEIKDYVRARKPQPW